MSGFEGIVETTHDSGTRLYWELQPKVSVPQWDSAELTAKGQQSSDIVQAEAGRVEMKNLCGVCHADSWVDGYFENIDNTVSDYNMVHEYTLALLNSAYEEKLIDPSNPIDETPEVMYYYIWHHDGRRWRMGASMIGPDWTHWNGAVDALLDKLNTMEEWINGARVGKELETRLADNEKNLTFTENKLAETESKLEEAEEKIASILADQGAGTQSNTLLLPAAIVAIGVIIAALLLRQKTQT
jgi:hypothetical protein